MFKLKIVALLFCFLFINKLLAQIVTIPDLNFKDALVNQNVVDTNGDGAGDIDVDTNNDGEIQVSEALAVDNLIISKTPQTPQEDRIASLEGIESFLNLERLRCKYNKLTTLDFSSNLSLIFLECGSNEITSINVLENSNLWTLSCGNNQLSSIDVTQNLDLEFLFCSNNFLEDIDVSQNILLKDFVCRGNLLTSLDITNNPNIDDLWCFDNLLTSLDLSQNQLLTVLRAYNNYLSTIDLSNNPILHTLDIADNTIVDIDLSVNSNLTSLECQNNNLVSLKINNGNNNNLTRMLAQGNPNLDCITVDDVDFSNNQICNQGFDGWCKDETAHYSKNCNLSIEDDLSTWNFTIIPNPANHILYIPANPLFKKLEIYSLSGSLMLEANSSSVNVSGLPKGIYLVNYYADEKKYVNKFIKL